MKLRHIFNLALAALLAIGCSDENTIDPLGSIVIDQTYVSIPQEGGDASITVKARGAWAFDDLFMTITRNDDGTRDTTYAALPAWLTADKLAGEAGETTVTFHAEGTNGRRETELRISTGIDKQFLIVRQGSMEASDATCKDIIDGPEGKTYRVTGTVTRIAGAQYGNFDITDETGTVYIYGIFDKDGKKGNNPLDGPTGWGIEMGDIVTLEGPKQVYNGTVELVDATVVKVVKSLLKVVTPEQTVGIEGADIDVKLAYKGSGAYAQLPADCDWVSIQGEDYVAGVPTFNETNPADTAIVHLRVAPNTGEGRKVVINFSSSNASGESTIAWTLKQDAFTLPHGQTPDDPFTVEEAIAKCKEIGSTSDGIIYYARGYISSIKEVSPLITRPDGTTSGYGNATFNIRDDGSDDNALTCYRSYSLDNQKFVSEDEIAVGDEVIICGKLVNFTRDNASFTPEFSGNVYIVSRKAAGPGSRLRPFNADEAIAFINDNLEVGQTTEDDYYIEGEIVRIDNPEKNLFNAQYGNASFYIATDEDPANDQFYVYRTLYLGNRKWVEGDTQIQVGDQVVICGKLTKYQDKSGNIIPETAQNKTFIYSLNGKKE